MQIHFVKCFRRFNKQWILWQLFHGSGSKRIIFLSRWKMECKHTRFTNWVCIYRFEPYKMCMLYFSQGSWSDVRRGAPVSAGVPNPDLLTTITVSLILRSSECSKDSPSHINGSISHQSHKADESERNTWKSKWRWSWRDRRRTQIKEPGNIMH